jgi:phosphoribosyl 1,2-cyclic phosphodiesterase
MTAFVVFARTLSFYPGGDLRLNCEVFSLTTVHTLASGSSGNALLLSCNRTRLLVDVGISCRRVTASLRELGAIPEELSAVLITHTHTDHVSGLRTLLKRTRFPVFVTAQAGRELCCRLPEVECRLAELPLCCPFSLGDVTVTAFPTSHDAPGSCGFRFDTPDGGVGVLTDTGYVTDQAASVLPGVDLAVLEANHDVETLRSGPYPYYLKDRVLGLEGHLCNEDAARFAVTLAETGATEIVLAHLSQENNTPAMAQNAVATALSAAGLDPFLSVAPRDTLGEAHVVQRSGICKG